jgi:hypothetical protein
MKQRALAHALIAMQLHQQVRKAGYDKTIKEQSFRDYSSRHGLNLTYITWIYGKRKRTVDQYIHGRRIKSTLVMARQGLTIKQTALKIGIHEKTAAKYLKEARKGIALLPNPRKTTGLKHSQKPLSTTKEGSE